MKLRLSILAAVLAALIATPGAPAASKATYYLSLGDSLAQGYQPIGCPWSPTAPPGYNHGYADQLFKLTRDRYGSSRRSSSAAGARRRRRSASAAICSYEQGSQLAAAVGIPRRIRRGGRLRHDRHRRERRFQRGGVPEIAANLPVILETLQAAAAPVCRSSR